MTTKTLSIVTATLLLSTNTFADITLEDINVISTNKIATSIQNTTANISVITDDDIKEHGYQTVAQAINTIAGVSVAHSGGLGQQTSFFVRGADSGKVLVLLDGMRLNDPSTTNGTALLDTLTTDNIAQIEVIKGGSGSIWGSNASAGIINIITKNPQDGVHGSLGLTYGSYTTKGADVTVGYKDDKLTAQILASYLDTKGFSALAPRDAEADGYNNKNANLKLGYIIDDNNKINLSYNQTDTKTEYDDNFSTTKSNDSYSNATANQSNILLDYSYVQDEYSATLHASKGNYSRDYYTKSAFGKGHNVYKATLEEYSLINAYDYSLGRAILGIEYKNIDGFNQYNTFPKSQTSYTNKAIYLSNTYNINNHILLESNLRYDNYSKFENKVSYKIGVRRHIYFIDGLSMSTNYYTSYDAPSAYQLANPAPKTTLKPSYTKGYDLTLRYKKLLSVAYFNNKVQDSIDYVGKFPNAGYANISGSSKFSGLEIDTQYTLPAIDITFKTNYTHLFEYKKEDGTNLARRAKDTINSSLTYYMQNNMNIGVDVEYVGDRKDTKGESTGKYSVWNLNFGTKIVKDVDLSINAKNILNKNYQSVYGYATPGRSVYAKVNYSF